MYNNYRSGILLFDILCSMLLAFVGITACARVLITMMAHLDDLRVSLATLNGLVRVSHDLENVGMEDGITHYIRPFSSTHASFGPYQLPPYATIQVETIQSSGKHALSVTTAHVVL